MCILTDTTWLMVNNTFTATDSIFNADTATPLQTTTPCKYTHASTNYYTIQVHLCLYKLPHHVGTPMPLQYHTGTPTPLQTTTPCRYTYASTNYHTMQVHLRLYKTTTPCKYIYASTKLQHHGHAQ